MGVSQHGRAARTTSQRGRRRPRRRGRNAPTAPQLAVDLDGRSPRTIPRPRSLPFDPVDVASRQPGVRRAQVRVERAAAHRRARRTEAARAANGRAAWSGARPVPSNATGTSSDANAVSSGARIDSTDGHTTAISSGPSPPARSRGSPRPTSSSAPRARALEEADRAVEARRSRGASANSARSRCASDAVRELAQRGRQLEHSVAGERGEVTGGPRERRVRRASRLVGQRDVDVRPRRERLEETPFGRGQVLEAVGQDGSPVPGVELAGQAPDRIPAESAAIPCAEALELVPVPADEPRERLARDRRGSTSAPSTSARVRASASANPGWTTARRVRVARRPGGAGCAARVSPSSRRRRRFRPRAPRRGRRTSRRCPPRSAVAARRSSRSDAVDVRPVRHDQPRARGRSRPRSGRAAARPSRRVAGPTTRDRPSGAW